ncbi:MAG: DUF5615 family PIN-like protein [Halobacteriales archaeon]
MLDEHVSRVFETVLSQHGYEVCQAKDRFGEEMVDEVLLNWCHENRFLLLTNNAADFEELHEELDHEGIFLYRDQDLIDRDPEGTARAVEQAIEQYGVDGLENEVVTLDEWYDWLHG